MEWHPSPRVRGGKHVSVPRIGGPGAIHERIPSNASEVRLPHHAVAGHVRVRAIVIQVTHTVAEGSGIVLRVLIVVSARLFVPGIERGFRDLVGDDVFVVIRSIKFRCFLLLNSNFAVGTFDVYVAFKDRQTRRLSRGFDSEMRGMIEGGLFAGEVQTEFVSALAQPVDVGHAVNQIDHRDALAGVAQAERTELHNRIWSQAQGAAIFKFNFRAAAVMRSDLRSLRNREIEERVLEAQSCVFVDLN